MNGFIRIRDGIRQFVLSREMLFIKLWNALVALVGLICIKNNFGYQKTVSQAWFCLLVAVVCAFLPMQGVSIVLMLVILIDLSALSLQAAIVALGLIIIGYLICAYFRSRNTYNMVTVPVLYSFNCPFVMTLGTGLMANLNELCSILCGTVLSFYLHIIKNNSASILDETTEFSILTLLKEQVLMNKMFYFLIVATTAMFLVVYLFRSASIKMSWLIADVAGVVIEFTIMLAGYLLTSQRSEIPNLIIGNIVVLLVGIFLNYFVLDLDYSRIEKVQFEDDDYYYYAFSLNSSSDANSVGFYWMNSTGAAFTNGVHKAYLKLAKSNFNNGASARAFVFSADETNAIRSINDEQPVINNASAYNIAGQHVNANHKGIVIKNGRKLINM